MYSPYENWEQSPVRIMRVNNGVLSSALSDNSLHFFNYLADGSLLLLDSLQSSFTSPFFLGHSINDIQFLIKRSKKETILFNSAEIVPLRRSQLRGVSMQLINSEIDLAFLDQSLNAGIPMMLVAGEGSSNFQFNQIMTSTGSAADCMNALLGGRNLIVVSKEDVFSADVERIPVIRNIEWKNDELTIDLSKKGNIQVVSSGFTLDTLSQNLHLKINHANWFRFKVDFKDEVISYISNPFFRYSQNPFKMTYPKANNQLTIFINLSWLITIFLLNYFINKFRRKYL